MADDEKDNSANCNSLLYQILYSKNTKSRDLILSIASHCQRFSLSNVFLTQDDVKAILNMPTQQVVMALDEIMTETPYTKRILTLKTTLEHKMISFKSENYKLYEDEA